MDIINADIADAGITDAGITDADIVDVSAEGFTGFGSQGLYVKHKNAMKKAKRDSYFAYLALIPSFLCVFFMCVFYIGIKVDKDRERV